MLVRSSGTCALLLMATIFVVAFCINLREKKQQPQKNREHNKQCCGEDIIKCLLKQIMNL